MVPAVDDGEGGVDSVRGQQIVAGLEIGGRKAECPATRVAVDDPAVDEILVPQQRGGLVDAALPHQPPDASARHDEVLVADRIDLVHPETAILANGSQQRERAGSVAAEEKIGAHPDLGDMQPVDEHRFDERFGRPLRHRRRESHHRDALQARAFERLDLLVERHQQRRRLVGPQHARRMRIENQRDGRARALGRLAAHALQQFHVAAMDAVESCPARRPGRPSAAAANRETRRPARVRSPAQAASMVSPAWASAMPGGSAAHVASCPRSCAMCVNHVRVAPIRRAIVTASATVKCVGWGRWRRASRMRWSRPWSAERDASGMPLQSVR